jgi:cell division protein FtsX
MSFQIAAPLPVARAVIAEARRRQRRRRTIAGLGAVVLVLAASAAFHAFPFGQRSASEQRTVKVYLDSSATPLQARQLLAAAQAEHGVAAVRLITKEAALADMKRRFPSLVAKIAYNPLPTSIVVQVRNGADAARLVSDLRRHLHAGIAKIQASPAQG